MGCDTADLYSEPEDFVCVEKCRITLTTKREYTTKRYVSGTYISVSLSVWKYVIPSRILKDMHLTRQTHHFCIVLAFICHLLSSTESD